MTTCRRAPVKSTDKIPYWTDCYSTSAVLQWYHIRGFGWDGEVVIDTGIEAESPLQAEVLLGKTLDGRLEDYCDVVEVTEVRHETENAR